MHLTVAQACFKYNNSNNNNKINNNNNNNNNKNNNNNSDYNIDKNTVTKNLSQNFVW